MLPTFNTYRYRGWFIHETVCGNLSTFRIQGPDYSTREARSLHSAKCLVARAAKRTQEQQAEINAAIQAAISKTRRTQK